MIKNKITFALYYGNRGFFPAEVIADARKSLRKTVSDLGYGFIETDETVTRYGAVETIYEGQRYARFLRENEGKYEGAVELLGFTKK